MFEDFGRIESTKGIRSSSQAPVNLSVLVWGLPHSTRFAEASDLNAPSVIRDYLDTEHRFDAGFGWVEGLRNGLHEGPICQSVMMVM